MKSLVEFINEAMINNLSLNDKLIQDLCELMMIDGDKKCCKYLNNWIKKNNVNKIKITLYGFGEEFGSLEDIQDEYPNFSIESKDYEDYENDSEFLTQGPGFNSDYRDEVKWNKDKFATGSDTTYYIILTKI